MKLKALFLTVLTFFFFLQAGFSQDVILSTMKNKAEIIAHVKIIDIQGGLVEEDGVEEWSALCKVIEPIKGDIVKNNKIRFRFHRFIFDGKEEPMLVKKGKKYIIFLNGKSGKTRFRSDKKVEDAYTLLDHWVGVMSDNLHLVSRLTGRY